MFIRDAMPTDATAISELVNKAYRPDNDVGWTSEAGLISGSRISPNQVVELFRPDSSILVMCEAEPIIGCVHIERTGNAAYIGMLACEPALQNAGIGKQLLAAAEAKALELFAPEFFKMSVLSKRPELLAFYQRRGYQLTGEREPFPVAAGVGVPVAHDVQILMLQKAVV